MNWKRFFLNLGGVAAAGFGAVVVSHAPGASITGHDLLLGAVAPVVANLVGLFQPHPAQE